MICTLTAGSFVLKRTGLATALPILLLAELFPWLDMLLEQRSFLRHLLCSGLRMLLRTLFPLPLRLAEAGPSMFLRPAVNFAANSLEFVFFMLTFAFEL